RLLNVVAVAIDVAGNPDGFSLSPAVTVEQALDLIIHGGRKFELYRAALGQFQEFFEFAIFGPIPRVAAPLDILALVMPSGDGGVSRPPKDRTVPQFQRDWLPSRQPAEFSHRHLTVRRAQVFSEAEARVMGGEGLDHPLIAFG